MAAATLIIGRAKGVARPAILTVMPAPAGPVALLDSGANVDAKPEYLLQFAHMGRAYVKAIFGVDAPRVGLLSVGAEATKGSSFVQEVHAMLATQFEGFAGNAEGNDVFSGNFDCIVTDGFTGNIVLKAAEGTASALLKELKRVLTSSFIAKIGAALVKGKLGVLKKTMSADTYGGAPLLGLKNVVIIGHGSSNVTAITNAIRVAATMVRAQIPKLIEEAITAIEKPATAEDPGALKEPSAPIEPLPADNTTSYVAATEEPTTSEEPLTVDGVEKPNAATNAVPDEGATTPR